MNNNQMTCDPERIELFLQQQLSDEEQTAFELHLDDCNDCRRRLEATAAGDDIWSGVRDSLLDQQLPPDHPAGGARLRSGDSALDSATGGDALFNHGTVLKLLAPTDDDRMLGRLGTYEVMGVIGSGGMGVVLKAFDAALNRYVAIKVLAPHLGSSGTARQRFSREAQAAAAVVHDNVIEIHGVADADGLPYLVMPYVRGPSLQRRLDDEGPLALVEILRIPVQAATGLAAAHAQGLVHRDVTPANILLGDGVERVILTDFGLARAADDASLTKTGIIAGTPQYMSPEQARGESVGQKSDLFSLGSVLYTMCTGRAPFRAETSYGVLRRITDEEPKPIREIHPDIPEWLCEIIATLLSKQPDDRFESAREVAELLEECLAHVQQPDSVPVPAKLATPQRARTQEPPSWFRRSRLAVAGGMLFLVAAVVIILELNKGTLTIECAKSDVAVRILKGDRVHKTLTVTPRDNSVRIAAGVYVVEIEGEHDGLEVKDGVVRLLRGGSEIVQIVEQAKTSEPSFRQFQESSTNSRGLVGRWKIMRLDSMPTDVLVGAKAAIDKESIYFYVPTQKGPHPHFHYTLKPDGGIDLQFADELDANAKHLGKYLLKGNRAFIAFNDMDDVSLRPVDVTGEIPQRGVIHIVLERDEDAGGREESATVPGIGNGSRNR